jgi:hypothetical protein
MLVRGAAVSFLERLQSIGQVPVRSLRRSFMPCCATCGRLLDDQSPACRGCGTLIDARRDDGAIDAGEVPPLEEAQSVPFARFRSGAEAGYFADELTRETGIEIEVAIRERFEGTHAGWTLDYVLHAPAEETDRAVHALQTLVRNENERDSEGNHSPAERAESRGVPWMPLVLTLAAGSIAFWGGERIEQRQRPPALVDRDPRVPPNLWHLLGATRGAWIQRGNDGSTRELTLDSDRRKAVLREDHDGDGAFDRELRFEFDALADRPPRR